MVSTKVFFLFPPSPNVGNPRSATELLSNKNAFQWDAYRLLVDRISRSIRSWDQRQTPPPGRHYPAQYMLGYTPPSVDRQTPVKT